MLASTIKYPIGKSIFAVNLPLKPFHASVANADIGNLKSLHTLFDKYLDHMLVKFEQNNCMVQTTRNFELFGKKWVFKTIFDSVDAILEDVFFFIWNNCLMLNY